MKFRDKNKNSIFLCQITERALAVAKCLPGKAYKRTFTALEVLPILPDTDEKEISERLIQLFKKLGYKNNPVICAMPRGKVTCRYLKVPTQIPKEIENIISLQASRYLPYQSNELVTGYQVIYTDKQGFSGINLTIVHKDVVERYLKVFRELKTKNPVIALSSYGLCNFYNYIKPGAPGSAMVIDVDNQEAEIVISSTNKMLFSRYLKLNPANPDWKSIFMEEIKKTQDGYAKEMSCEAPAKIILMGAGKTFQELSVALSQGLAMPVEALSYASKVNLGSNIASVISRSQDSFACLFGLGLAGIGESLNLLPQEQKQESRNVLQRKEYIRQALVVLGIFLIIGIGVAKNLKNKEMYLARLQQEVNKIEKEARPLEEMEKKLKFMENRLQKKPSSLDVLYELHQVLPAQVYLVNLIYEEDKQVIIRGETPELNAVFTFVSQLEQSQAFKNFNNKVRYASKKITAAGELIDFEITCFKRE